MVKLGVKDIKLLYYLSLNSRESHSKIASQLKISNNSVKYKIEEFLKEGIINNFSAVINIGALGETTTSFTVLLKFNKDLQKDKEIIEYFVKHPFAGWVISLSGNYDLFVEFITKDVIHLTELIKEIKNHFKEDLNNYKVSLSEETLRVEHLVKDIYSNIDLPIISPKKRNFNTRKLDNLDKKILSVLSKNSNKSLVEIAKEINSTWDVVRYRMKCMEKDGIIIKYFPEINLQRLGYLRFLCELNFHGLNIEKIKDIKNDIKMNDNITYAFLVSNSPSILLDCAFKSINDLDSFLSGLQGKFKENIFSIEYYIVRDQLKFDLFPEGLLDIK